MTVLANERGLLSEVARFSYEDIQCQLNKDLADYFKMFYAGPLTLTISLKPQGLIFATCQVDIK